jgi:hypothetical protein
MVSTVENQEHADDRVYYGVRGRSLVAQNSAPTPSFRAAKTHSGDRGERGR